MVRLSRQRGRREIPSDHLSHWKPSEAVVTLRPRFVPKPTILVQNRFSHLKYARVVSTDLKRMRLLCGLRQLDVSFCTGVPVSALGAAEQGRKPLNNTELALVVSFLNRRWQTLRAIEQMELEHSRT